MFVILGLSKYIDSLNPFLTFDQNSPNPKVDLLVETCLNIMQNVGTSLVEL